MFTSCGGKQQQGDENQPHISNLKTKTDEIWVLLAISEKNSFDEFE